MMVEKAKRLPQSSNRSKPLLAIAEFVFSTSLIFLSLCILQPAMLKLAYTFVAGIALWLFWPLVCLAVFCFMLIPDLRMNGNRYQVRTALLLGLSLISFCIGSFIMMLSGFGA